MTIERIKVDSRRHLHTASRNRIWLGVAAFVFVGAGAYFVVNRVLKPPSPRCVWSAATGNPVPNGFCYLLLPRDFGCELQEADGRKTNRPLERAIMCSEKELNTGELLAVWDQGQELRVDKSTISYDPLNLRFDILVANWKKTVSSWGNDTDWPVVDVQATSLGLGRSRIRLTRTNRKRDTDTFVYLVEDGKAKPEEWLFTRPLFDFIK